MVEEISGFLVVLVVCPTACNDTYQLIMARNRIGFHHIKIETDTHIRGIITLRIKYVLNGLPSYVLLKVTNKSVYARVVEPVFLSAIS